MKQVQHLLDAPGGLVPRPRGSTVVDNAQETTHEGVLAHQQGGRVCDRCGIANLLRTDREGTAAAVLEMARVQAQTAANTNQSSVEMLTNRLAQCCPATIPAAC